MPKETIRPWFIEPVTVEATILKKIGNVGAEIRKRTERVHVRASIVAILPGAFVGPLQASPCCATRAIPPLLYCSLANEAKWRVHTGESFTTVLRGLLLRLRGRAVLL